MIQLILAVASAFLFLALLAVRQVYYCVPEKELKRLARAHDRVGTALYGAVAFGGSLTILLWLLIAGSASASVLLFSASVPTIIAACGVAGILLVGFGWVASSFPRNFTVRFTAAISPAVVWILRHVHGVLRPVSSLLRRRHRVLEHTGLYDKEDLTALLARQKEQLDNRMLVQDIELTERVLAFNEKTVADLLLPRQKIPLVHPDDTIGPKFLSELHASGQSIFPVWDGAGEAKRIVGLVRLDDLVRAKQGGAVKALASDAIYFVREDFSLSEVLHAFRQTKQPLLVVINNFEEYLGVVLLDSVLEQLFGAAQPDQEAPVYGDAHAIAAWQTPEPEILPAVVNAPFEEPAVSAPTAGETDGQSRPASDTAVSGPTSDDSDSDGRSAGVYSGPTDTQEKSPTQEPEVVE